MKNEFSATATELGELTLNADNLVVHNALNAIQRMRQAGKDAVPYIIKSLDVIEPAYRREEKVFTLGAIGPHARMAEPKLFEMLSQMDFSEELSQYIIQALGRMKSVAALPYYLKALDYASNRDTYYIDFAQILGCDVFANLRTELNADSIAAILDIGKKSINKCPAAFSLLGAGSPCGAFFLETALKDKMAKRDREYLLGALSAVGKSTPQLTDALTIVKNRTRRKDFKKELQQTLASTHADRH